MLKHPSTHLEMVKMAKFMCTLSQIKIFQGMCIFNYQVKFGYILPQNNMAI